MNEIRSPFIRRIFPIFTAPLDPQAPPMHLLFMSSHGSMIRISYLVYAVPPFRSSSFSGKHKDITL